MIGRLLLRGMLAGVIAGLLAFGFGRMLGEPQVERAIAFETHEHAAAGEAPEPELVSRATQSGIGLLTGVVAYGAAFGGLFALTFAFAWGRGRAAKLGARPLAGWLALAAFVALVAVPSLKYPANPPSVGDPDTIGYRTALYFLTIAVSIAIMVLSLNLRDMAARKFGESNGALIGIVAYVVMVTVVLACLPDIDEVPAAFPAALLWKFRMASLGMQAIVWTGIGAIFGVLAERASNAEKRSPQAFFSVVE